MQREPQLLHRAMEPGVHGADGDAQRLGRILDGEVEIVVEDDDGPVVDRQPTEPALELITVMDIPGHVESHRLPSSRDARQRLEPALRLAVARSYDEPIAPGIEARGVAKLRERLPDLQERFGSSSLRVGLDSDSMYVKVRRAPAGQEERGAAKTHSRQDTVKLSDQW